MHEVRLKIWHASLLLCALFWVFDVVTPEWVGAGACFWWEISRDHFYFFRLQQIFEAERNVIPKLASYFRSEVGSCLRYLDISSSCLLYLSKKEILFFAPSSVCSYLFCPVRPRGGHCSRKVKDGWFVGLFIFFNLGEQQVIGLLLNSEQSACDD